MRLCPGCLFQRLTLSEKPCAFCGRVAEHYAPRTGERLHPFVRFVRWLLQPLGWPTHVLTVTVTVICLCASTVHYRVNFLLLLTFVAVWIVVWFVWLTRLLVRFIVAAFYRRPGWAYRTGWKTWLVTPLLMAAVVGLSYLDVPLRLAFWISRPAMERMATWELAKAATTKPKTPSAKTLVGFYKAREITRVPGGVSFVVSESGFFDRETFGFAYFPKVVPPAHYDTFKMSHTYGTYTRLSGKWYIWEETMTWD